jgi:hypothetical protein
MDLSQIDGRIVKVGSKKYTIRIKKSIKKGALLGQSKHYEEVIEISLSQSENSFADTLMHEILHCIWYDNGIGYAIGSEQIEEFIVSSYAGSLMAVFMDNPWILKFISDINK